MPKPRYPVKLEMNEKELKRFMEIKEHYGIHNDAEVLRLAIKDAHMIVQERKKILSKLSKKEIDQV